MRILAIYLFFFLSVHREIEMGPSSFCPLGNQHLHTGRPIFEQLELVLDPIPEIDIRRIKQCS